MQKLDLNQTVEESMTSKHYKRGHTGISLTRDTRKDDRSHP